MIRNRPLLNLFWILALLVSAPLAAQQQFARPDGTIGSTADYTVTGAGTHWEVVGEVIPDDGDFIQTTANPGVIEFSLTDSIVDPAVDSGHIIKFRSDNSGGKKAANITISLYEGAGLVGENTFSVPKGASWTEYSYTLPAAVISNYDNLSIRLSGDGSSQTPSLISWVELETPPQGVVADPPTLAVTPTSADITENSATLSGNVTLDGGATVTSRGVEWGTTPGGPYPSSQSAAAGGTGIFTVPVTGLNPGTDYYFRAWAINSSGTGNSGEGSFTTNTPASAPTVIDPTIDGPSITNSSALLGGNVTLDGGATVTDRGIVWNTTSPAETGGTIVSEGSGLGIFTRLVSSLPAGTLIYFKAYATNTAGTAYSVENSFTTLAGLATVTVDPASSITATSGFFSGEVTSDGGAAVTDRGTVWGTTPNPTGNILAAGSGLGTFGHTRSGLPTGTLVYFRTYAINSAGTAYSADQSFTPSAPPVMGPPTKANINYFSAQLGGIITSDGGNPILSRGTVWNITGTPVVENAQIEGGTAVSQAFSHTRFLTAGDTVFYRAFATTVVGTGYSTEDSFVVPTEPDVQATNVTFPRIAASSLRISWTRGNGEGSIVVMRLTATGKTDPADGNDYTANPDFTLAPELPTNSNNFVVYKGSNNAVVVTGLTLNTSYSVAVYEFAGTGATVDYLQLLPAQGSQSTNDIPVHNLDNNVDCTQCHNHGGSPTFVPQDAALKTVCQTCHDIGQVAAAKLEFDNHLTPNKNPAIDFVDCGYCHEVHNPNTSDTTQSLHPIDLVTRTNKSFLRANVDKYVATAIPPAALHTDDPGHADPPNLALTPDRAVEGGTQGYCQVCHTLTNYHRNVDAVESNQCHDGEGGEESCINAAPEINCGRCHQHNNRFQGVGGSQTCIECHSSAQNTRPIITTQFDRNSAHITAGSTAITQPDCQVCHAGDHPGTGKVGALDADDGTTIHFQLTGFADTTATGEGELFEPHCMSCHDDGVASSLDPSVGDQTQTSPFIGSGAPPVIGVSNWAGAAHNRPTSGSPTGPFGANPVSCVGNGANGCHASGHGTDSISLLANAAEPDPAAGAAVNPTDFCFNCHDSNGPSSLDISNDFTPLVPLEYIDGGTYATVNKQHDVLSDDQIFSGQSLACVDCHNPHVNSDAEPVAVPGSSGVALNTYSPTGTYTGDAASFNYNAGGTDISPVDPQNIGWTEPDYIEFCLTCHDGTRPDSVAMPATMLNIAETWATSQHGASSNRSTQKGWLKFPFTNAPPPADGLSFDDGTTPYAAMNCNLCHGPHGSENIYNLRSKISVGGVQMTVGASDVWVAERGQIEYILPDGKGGTQEDLAWGAWCSFCHDVNHDTKTGAGCQGTHMHGAAGNF